MRGFERVRGGVIAALLSLVVAVPSFAFADDKTEEKRDGASTARPAPKMEAPVPLTERERWLLDRVEQLEKRVADLESAKGAGEVKSAEPGDTAATASKESSTEVS